MSSGGKSKSSIALSKLNPYAVTIKKPKKKFPGAARIKPIASTQEDDVLDQPPPSSTSEKTSERASGRVRDTHASGSRDEYRRGSAAHREELVAETTTRRHSSRSTLPPLAPLKPSVGSMMQSRNGLCSSSSSSDEDEPPLVHPHTSRDKSDESRPSSDPSNRAWDGSAGFGMRREASAPVCTNNNNNNNASSCASTRHRHHLQLDTYYDSSDMFRLLQSLQEACGNGLDVEDEAQKMARTRAIALPGASRAPRHSRLNDLPADVLLQCFSFCGMPAMAELSHVSRRIAALSSSDELWLAHAAAYQLALTSPRGVKEQLREAIAAFRQHYKDEERQCAVEYKALTQRMKERVEDELADCVDVDATLASVEPQRAASPPAAAVSQLTAELERLEGLREEALRRLHNVSRRMEQQQAFMDALTQRLHGSARPPPKMGSDITVVGITPATTTTTPNNSNNNVSGEDPLSLDEVLRFERRMVKLVLAGRNLATARVGGGEELPVVLRRGVTDFGVLEVLCASSSIPASTIKPIHDRWTAFKRFFPLDDAYYTARSALNHAAIAAAASPSGPVSGANPSVPHPSSSPTTTTNNANVSKKSEQAIARVMALLRRVDGMKDHEIMDVVM